MNQYIVFYELRLNSLNHRNAQLYPVAIICMAAYDLTIILALALDPTEKSDL